MYSLDTLTHGSRNSYYYFNVIHVEMDLPL